MFNNKYINLIVATDLNGGIGYKGQLPWPEIPEDRRWFRKKTEGQIVIMGRKTLESIGSLLPNRHNVILTSTFPSEIVELTLENAECNYSVYKDINLMLSAVTQAPELKGKEIFIIGGADTYADFMEMQIVDKVYLTLVCNEYKSDRWFHIEEFAFPYWIPKLIERSGECEFWAITRR